MVGSSGLEPPTSRLSGVRSNHLSYEPLFGGDERDRTDDPLLAKQVLSQLSYTPIFPECSFEPQKLNNEIKVLIIWPWMLNSFLSNCQVSIERRWSSRTFRYGYLVTTSPQSPILPSAASSCVRLLTSGITGSHGVTGGVYKARERIHRGMLIRDY